MGCMGELWQVIKLCHITYENSFPKRGTGQHSFYNILTSSGFSLSPHVYPSRTKPPLFLSLFFLIPINVQQYMLKTTTIPFFLIQFKVQVKTVPHNSCASYLCKLETVLHKPRHVRPFDQTRSDRVFQWAPHQD